MSGYLEVKYPFKSNIGLNPFKSWRRQWCILRPSPTRAGGGSLAVYCSEAGAAAGCVELPPGCLVRRAKSRSRPHAFAVFADDQKPKVLFAAATAHEAQLWMDKICLLLQGNKLLGTESLLKDSYSVTISDTDLSIKCGLTGDGTLALIAKGVVISQQMHGAKLLVEWKHMKGATLSIDKTICALSIDSGFCHGEGALRLRSPLAAELATALREAGAGTRGGRLSRSHGDLRQAGDNNGATRRISWNSEPSEVSLDDTDLIMSKDVSGPRGLSRCDARDLATSGTTAHSAASLDESMCDRRSLISIASGIYEEIPEVPTADCVDGFIKDRNITCKEATQDPCLVPTPTLKCEDPLYECVGESLFGTARRRRHKPPPLPPRTPFGTTKLGESWNSRLNADAGVTRHCSLGSLPRCCSIGSSHSAHSAHSAHSDEYKTKTLPKEKTKQAFSVFRKRLKSDSRVATSPKSETTKENTDTKKKRFDFTPTKDIFRSFKVGRKMKGLKLTGNLTKIGETKSCEFLDDTEHVSTKRCSKSVENLDGDSDFVDDLDDVDLSLDSGDVAASLALPPDILELMMQSRTNLPPPLAEGAYAPMSPRAPQEHHYIVMSPRTNVA